MGGEKADMSKRSKMKQVDLGGDRLGAAAKNRVYHIPPKRGKSKKVNSVELALMTGWTNCECLRWLSYRQRVQTENVMSILGPPFTLCAFLF